MAPVVRRRLTSGRGFARRHSPKAGNPVQARVSLPPGPRISISEFMTGLFTPPSIAAIARRAKIGGLKARDAETVARAIFVASIRFLRCLGPNNTFGKVRKGNASTELGLVQDGQTLALCRRLNFYKVGFRGAADSRSVRRCPPTQGSTPSALDGWAPGQWNGRHTGDGRVSGSTTRAGRPCASTARRQSRSRASSRPLGRGLERRRVNRCDPCRARSRALRDLVFQADCGRYRWPTGWCAWL